MIQISRIDNDLSIYRENDVIVLGTSQKVLEMVAMLDINDIVPKYICTEGFHNKISINGFKSISLSDVRKLCENNNVIVQLADSVTNACVLELPPDKVITHSEAVCVIVFLDKLKERVEFPHLVDFFQTFGNNKKSATQDKVIKSVIASKRNPVVMICTPPKAGAHSLMKTFADIGLPFHMMWHSPDLFLKDEFLVKDSTFKIIASVREPISRDISSMYQGLEFMVTSPMLNVLNIHENNPHFMTGGGDAQEVFDLVFNSKEGKNSIDDYLLSFKDNIIDLLAYPFDKENGYSIIKEDKIEVFVFQLEKLDSLTQELSDWLEFPISQLLRDNSGDFKWTASSYSRAKQCLQIDRGYFNKCFNSPWIKHFYSDDDIALFMSRWEKNLKG